MPLAIAILLLPPTAGGAGCWTAGAALVWAGEGLRLWAVRHIGAISRTRSDRLGPLVQTGPFSLVRNPLYVGNILLWTGFAVTAHLVWLAPIIVLLLALQYHAIVRWEEDLLTKRLGESYLAYAARVPGWLPRLSGRIEPARELFSWSDTLFSERGTIIAIAVGYLLILMKLRLQL